MQENHETYTYTARNSDDPNKVVTFTLYNDHMRVSLTGVFEQAELVTASEEKPAELGRQISKQAKPVLIKTVENLSGPTHISDAAAQFEDEQLKVMLWQRIAGLRLVPVQFNMGRIDNADAAKAFVDELEQRKENAPNASRFFGILDYWVGWTGLLLLIGIFFRWSRRQDNK